MRYPGSGYVMRMRYGTLMRASLKYLSKIIDHSLKFFHHIDHVWWSHIVIQRVALCAAWCSVEIYYLSYCYTHTLLFVGLLVVAFMVIAGHVSIIINFIRYHAFSIGYSHLTFSDIYTLHIL